MSLSKDPLVCPVYCEEEGLMVGPLVKTSWYVYVCCEEEGQMEGPLVKTSWYVQYIVRERGGWKVLL